MVSSSAQSRLWSFVVLTLQTTLVIFVDGVDPDVCQSLCLCSDSESATIICTGVDLNAVPRGVPENITSLDVSHNNISILQQDDFRDMQSLKVLHLDHNHIRELQPGIFSNLSSLTTLSLINNALTALEADVFSGLSLLHLNINDNYHLTKLSADTFAGASVETLSLDRCAITAIAETLFMPLQDSLKYLHWSHSYEALALPMAVFDGLQIDSLRLSANSISDPTFLAATYARHIDLSENQMSAFNLSAYSGLAFTQSLKLTSNLISALHAGIPARPLAMVDLDISDNHLDELDKDIFLALPNITILDVSSNDIMRLSPELQSAFSRLSYLNLRNNPLICDCTINWYLLWDQIHNEVFFGEDLCPKWRDIIDAGECQSPAITDISDEQRGEGFVLFCQASGMPSTHTTLYVNITSHDNYTDYESTTHRISNSSSSTLFVDHPFQNSICISVTCVAENAVGATHKHIRNCYDAYEEIDTTERVEYHHTNYLVPLVVGMVCLSLVVAGAVMLCVYVRSKGAPWKSLLFRADHALGRERTLISDGDDMDDEREQMSTEAV